MTGKKSTTKTPVAPGNKTGAVSREGAVLSSSMGKKSGKPFGAKEGIALEFKRATDHLPSSFFDTVCAFLNMDGGVIMLGVEDDGTISGITARPCRMKDRTRRDDDGLLRSSRIQESQRAALPWTN